MDKIAQKSPFVMPDWMEPYREMFYSTGGNSVEYLIDALNIEGLSFSNSMLFSLALMAEAQVALLTQLHGANALNNAADQSRVIEVLENTLLDVRDKHGVIDCVSYTRKRIVDDYVSHRLWVRDKVNKALAEAQRIMEVNNERRNIPSRIPHANDAINIRRRDGS